MKIFISNFACIRNMTENCILISSAVWDPQWYHNFTGDKNYCFVDTKKNIMLGIREELLSPLKVDMTDGCCKNCPHKKQVPNCPFLIKYSNWLASVDFDYIMGEFERVAEDVRQVTHYQGEPNIIILVYEAADNPCSEREPLINWFKKHGVSVSFVHNAIDFLRSE